MRFLPIVLLLLLLGGGAGAQDPEALRRAEADLAAARAKLDTLEVEMIRAYFQIREDFQRLRDPDTGPKLRSDLADLARAVVETVPRGKGLESGLAQTLRARLAAARLLTGLVRERYADQVAERVVRFHAKPEDASRAALEELFPGDDVDEIWDTVFIDLETVADWRRANVEIRVAEIECERLREGGEDKIPAPPGMVPVPGGRFTFGPHGPPGWRTQRLTEERERRESLPGFYIDRHEVTNRQYAEFLAARPEEMRKRLVPTTWSGSPPRPPKGREEHPVTGVTFVQASAFAAWAGKRLPSELEWEKAARGPGEGLRWPWGNEFDAEALVWGGGGATGPARVLSTRKDLSPYYVSDMGGNVAEWTTTLSDGKTEVEGTPGDLDEIVIRGGSFRTPSDPEKTTTRFRWVVVGPRGSGDHIGFRCVLDEDVWRRRRKK
jgi:formylglycine-generating enzyme required for sulfatase activity